MKISKNQLKTLLLTSYFRVIFHYVHGLFKETIQRSFDRNEWNFLQLSKMIFWSLNILHFRWSLHRKNYMRKTSTLVRSMQKLYSFGKNKNPRPNCKFSGKLARFGNLVFPKTLDPPLISYYGPLFDIKVSCY